MNNQSETAWLGYTCLTSKCTDYLLFLQEQGLKTIETSIINDQIRSTNEQVFVNLYIM